MPLPPSTLSGLPNTPLFQLCVLFLKSNPVNSTSDTYMCMGVGQPVRCQAPKER